MARDVESLVLMMSADLRRFQRSMDQANSVAQKRLTAIESQALKSQKNLERIMARAGQGMVNSLSTSLKGLAPTLAAAFSTQQVIQYADAYTGLQNRLKATGLEGEALKRVEDGLYAAANRNGVAVEATAQLYQRASMARQNLGASEQQLMQIVSGTSAALKLQGTSAGEASGALLQLGQLLGGNMVQSQEYNSLIDGLPTVLEAVAKGSDRWGGSINKLTQDVKGGKVTSQEFFQAALKGFADIEARAAGSTTTVGAALQTLNNQLGRFVGQTDSSLSATARMAQGIEWLANNLDTVTQLVGVLAAIMGTRYVLAMTAGSGAMIAQGVASARLIAFQTAMTASMTGTTRATVLSTAAMRSFSAAIAANPIGAAMTAVTALTAGLVGLNHWLNENSKSTRSQKAVTDDLSNATAAYEKAVYAAANATGEAKEKALEEVRALRILQVEKRKTAEDAMKLAKASLAQAEAQLAANRAAAADPTNADWKTQNALNQVGGSLESRATLIEGNLEKVRKTIEEADAAIARIDGGMAAPVLPRGDDGKSKKSTGPTPAELAAQRQMLDLQAEIELLRAQGRTAEADAAQDRLDTLNLTAQYEKAEFTNAKAKAEQHVKALAAAREANRAAEEAAELAEGEARAVQLTRNFLLDMLDVQEQLALTDRDALDVRRQILAVRQAERRAALEAAAADADATEAERAAARGALANLPTLEKNENRALDGSSQGARDAQNIVADLRAPEDAIERAREAYAELDRLRQEDVISEQEAALAKAQIDADLREKRLAGTQMMLGALATLQNSSNKKLAALGKAAALAQATIDGVLAVQKAWGSAPYPFNLPAVAITTAATAANIASIAGMADGGPVRGVGGPREDNQLRWLSVGEYVVNAKAAKKNRAMLDAMNYGGGIARMADGGVVGVPNFPNVAALSRPSSSSFSYSPTIDARGADLAAIERLRQVMDEDRASFAERVNGVREKRARYRLGGRK